MLLKRPAAGLLGCALVLCACSGPREPDAGADAGRDGGRDSGARDAGRDGGRDAGHDAGPDDPEWSPLEGLPPDCVIERAAHPERVWRPPWEACPTQPIGCSRTVADALHPDVVFTSTAWNDGTVSYYRYAFPENAALRIAAIATPSGDVIAAWRRPEPTTSGPVCSIKASAIGDGYAAFAAHYYDPDAPTRSVDLVFHAPLAEIGLASAPTATLSGDRFGAAGNSPQNMTVSRDLVAMEMQPGAFVAVASGGSVQILEGGAVRGLPQHVTALGPHVIWEDWSDHVRLVHGSPVLTTPEVLLDVSPADVQDFGSDGSQLAWLQGYEWDGTAFARIELWTAPATADPALLAPRLVREMGSLGATVSGGGWMVVLRDAPRRLEVTSLVDGTQRQWVPVGYALPEGPIYASENEILIDTISTAGPTLVRLDPHSLPPE